MTSPFVDEVEHGRRKRYASQEPDESDKQNFRIMVYTVITIITASIATVGVGFLVAGYQQANRTLMIYSGLIAWIFTGATIAATMLKDAPESSAPTFSVAAITMIGTRERASGGLLWLAHQSYDGSTILSPAHRAILIRITNRQPVRSMIETYRVEVLNTRNAWTQLTHIDPTRGTVYAGDIGAARIISADQMLDHVIQQRNIVPRETIEGWALFEIPEDLGLQQPMRIFVKDFGGAEVTREIATDVNGFTQGSGLHILGGPTDLRSWRREYYSDTRHK
jgi:hypothetical protein